MKTTSINVGMKPSHPGDFIRTEILEELGLAVSKAAEVLDVRRATPSDLVNGKSTARATRCFLCDRFVHVFE